MDVMIPLDRDLSAFVESLVERGRFSTTSDVIREALHLFRSIDPEKPASDKLRAAWAGRSPRTGSSTASRRHTFVSAHSLILAALGPISIQTDAFSTEGVT